MSKPLAHVKTVGVRRRRSPRRRCRASGSDRSAPAWGRPTLVARERARSPAASGLRGLPADPFPPGPRAREVPPPGRAVPAPGAVLLHQRPVPAPRPTPGTPAAARADGCSAMVRTAARAWAALTGPNHPNAVPRADVVASPGAVPPGGPDDVAFRLLPQGFPRRPPQLRWRPGPRRRPPRDAPGCCVGPRYRGERCLPAHRGRPLGRRPRSRCSRQLGVSVPAPWLPPWTPWGRER